MCVPVDCGSPSSPGRTSHDGCGRRNIIETVDQLSKDRPGADREKPESLGAFGRMRRAWRRISPFFRASRSGIVLLVVLAVLAGLIEASLLTLIAVIAAALAENHATPTFTFGPFSADVPRSAMFAIAIALALARAGLQLCLAYLPARMSSTTLSDLRNQLFESFTSSAWSVKSAERDGAFQTLMTQNASYTAQAVINLGLGLTGGIMFLTMVVAAFVQSYVAAAMLLVTAIGLFIALRPLARTLRKYAKQLSREAMTFTNHVQEVVQMAEETEVFGATTTYRTRFSDHIEEVRRPLLRTRVLSAAAPGLYQSVALLLLVLALIAISVANVVNLATIAAVVLMLMRALTYAQQIQAAVTSLDERVPFINQIVDALERYRDSPQQDGPDQLDDVRDVALTNVSFGYRPDVTVLHDVGFELRTGEALGVVGPSGAGKSSIVQLLLRLRTPDTGAVRVNGKDVRQISRTSWQQTVAYVPQTSQVITGTVRENIRFFREWLTDEQIVEAARRAHIHDDIVSMSDGYDTVIGQRASAVSGGQRQRICLARALAGEPKILILDEPTSALDVRSEELVQQSLLSIKRDMAVVMIAHRLSTLSVCDRILVLVDGRVSAIGSRTDLLEQSEFFRQVSEITQRGHSDDPTPT